MTYDTISFLSDFGHDDEFVGVVHSVIRSLAPDVRVIDITHGITPHDTRAGGLALARAAHYLTPGVVLAVVDPGVGTQRRPVAVEVGDGVSVLVGPDNGLLAPAVGLVGGATRAVEITNPAFGLEAVGSTFDGRDVFAPAAAHLCNGVPITELGPEIDPAGLMPGVLPVSHLDGQDLVAEVLWVDRYGNCQLNVDPSEVGEAVQICVGETVRRADRVDAYDQIGPGAVGLLIDSSGLLAVAVPRGSAAADLSLHEGAQLRLRPLDAEPGTVTRVELGTKGDA